MLQNGLRQHLIFDDRIDELDRLAKTMTSDEVALAAAAIQKARDALMVNASPQLAFDGMMLGDAISSGSLVFAVPDQLTHATLCH